MQMGRAAAGQILQTILQQVRIMQGRIQQVDPPPQGRRMSI
jgi:hypothetical protein